MVGARLELSIIDRLRRPQQRVRGEQALPEAAGMALLSEMADVKLEPSITTYDALCSTCEKSR
eukprot:7618034-Pyramimonas_sp.AAC.1